MRTSFAFIALIGLLGACTSVGPTRIFQSTSPHDKYARSLKDAKLEQTALGRDWVAAGERALTDSITINAPYRESGYFASNRPFAIGYRLRGQRGDKYIIRFDVQGQEPVQVFIDVYELDDQPGKANPDRLISAKADTNLLELEVRSNQMHLIRLQPELLRSGRYTISVTREPVLSFPVKGRDSRAISSYFGVARDGGRRRHEGVDIFAPRGTPAVASTDGVVSGVGTTNLGGNVVWLSDSKRNQRLYYAHLDSQAVQDGQTVSVGDTLGYVGNTGNARTTSPHLHFGIYQFGGGAVDPLPYVRLSTGPARQVLVGAERLGDSLRVSVARAVVRQAPNGDSPIVRELPRSTLLTLMGGTAAWLRVALPDGKMGYVANSVTEAASRSLRRISLTAGTGLLEAALPTAAAIKTVPAGTAEVLGVYNAYQLIRHPSGSVGWVLNP
ncbi:M23 family metallopeptidase [Tellurirhabdus bombi]|uniref:M23 family metallopeptidase n=1 Tax=Tellurirhabdus bombi TaxID=2907205 RepID=UPI001F433DDE|nr:M23 family metallopeptidase [Tellurirhabdus bombi]